MLQTNRIVYIELLSGADPSKTDTGVPVSAQKCVTPEVN